MKDYLRMVLDHNESVQAQMLGTEADRRKYCAELGIFEPNLVGNLSRVGNHRQNNNEQTVSQSGAPEFIERNNVFDTGLESLLPTGGKIHFGYAISDLGNTLTPTPTGFGTVATTGSFSNQWQTFVGATLNQPLLKHAGFDATFGKIRLASLQSDIGFQQYRKELMLAVSRAENAYWTLYFTQEQLQFADESLHLAQSVLDDGKAKFDAGKGPELDVLEGRAGLAKAETIKNVALEKYSDAISMLYTLCGSRPDPTRPQLRAIDHPDCVEVPLSFAESYQTSFELNPEYLSQKKKVDVEAVRLGIKRNLMLPEVNAKAAYGYNGLGTYPYETSPHGSWGAIRSQNFPAWSIGLEVNVPLFGGITERNEFSAAKLTLKQEQKNLEGITTTLSNSLNNTIQKNRSILGTVHDFEGVVQAREELVKNTLAELQAGKIEARRVLEESKDLFEARESLAEAQVRYQSSLLELQLAEGSILKRRNLEITRKELRAKTIAMIKNGAFAPVAPQPVVAKKPAAK